MYFFRMIIISTEEIKCIGAFSSKDSAIINKDKSLIMSLNQKGKITVRLYGNNGTPTFNWANNENYKSVDIDIFREKAIGGTKSIARVLRYFEVPEEDILEIISKNEYEKIYENFILTKSTNDKILTFKLKFSKTI
jgi:hypothetical protein